MSDQKTPAARRPYLAPELVKVSLVVEESVLINCKRGGQAGPGAAGGNKKSCPSGQNCVNNSGS